jgi:hypothetical protein
MFYFEKRKVNVLGFNVVGEGSYNGLNFALLSDGNMIVNPKETHLYTKEWCEEVSKKLEETV